MILTSWSFPLFLKPIMRFLLDTISGAIFSQRRETSLACDRCTGKRRRASLLGRGSSPCLDSLLGRLRSPYLSTSIPSHDQVPRLTQYAISCITPRRFATPTPLFLLGLAVCVENSTFCAYLRDARERLGMKGKIKRQMTNMTLSTFDRFRTAFCTLAYDAYGRDAS